MTKNEKELVIKISTLMKRKGIEGNPAEFYKITKRSNKDYFVEVRVGNMFFSAKGQDSKEACKNIIKEMS